MPKKTYKSGETVPRSGQYEIPGPRGGRGPERTLTKGKPFPPTPAKGQGFKLVDPTRHS